MWWTVIRDALVVLALASFAYYVVAIIAAVRFFGARRGRDAVPSSFTPPLSILKPIYGLDRETYENYASFCLQDYPDYEILFCVSDDQDPAIPVIAELARNFPERSIQLIVGSEPLGVSDKVNKLCRMVRAAAHEIVVVSDSDVRVGPGYLRAIAGPFRDPKVGAVTCLYRGLTDGSLAANLEAIGNSTDFTAGVLVAWLLGDVNFTLGATMATTKTRLAEIGGFESLVDHFSDDYELGNRIAARGYRVELSTFPVGIVYPAQTLGDAFRHQLRWNLSIRYSRPAGHLGLIFTQGLALALLAAVFAPSAAWAVVLMMGYLILRGASAWVVGVWGMGDGLLRGKMELLPLRDLFAFVVWVVSFFPQRIHWRGKEFYVREKRLVAAGTRER
ncbi:MAG: bacteriohopanetetrol glucosamine biosynthesis glycosyltransferase HpnI [Candidatus Acidiferrales bacterium]